MGAHDTMRKLSVITYHLKGTCGQHFQFVGDNVGPHRGRIVFETFPDIDSCPGFLQILTHVGYSSKKVYRSKSATLFPLRTTGRCTLSNCW